MLRVLFGPELAAIVPWIVLVFAVTAALFVSVLVVARRRKSYASASMPLLAVAWSGVALGGCVAAWILIRALLEMAHVGGGFATISSGIWEAAQVLLASAWIGAAATLFALAVALRSTSEEPRVARAQSFWWTAGIAVAAGVVSVQAFRSVVAFIIQSVVPGYRPASWLAGLSLSQTFYMLIAAAGVVGALGFLTALVLARKSLRGDAAPLRVAVAVLVVSLTASAALVASLRSYSSCWQDVVTPSRSDRRIAQLLDRCAGAEIVERTARR